jgi:PAS domain S-box-containing protein
MAPAGERTGAQDVVINEARLRRAQRVARVGSWELDLSTNTMWGSDEAFRVYGLVKTEGNLLPFALVRDIPLPEYRAEMDQALRELANEGKPYEIKFRIRRPSDGAIRHIHSFGEVTRDPAGKPILLTGTIQDVTEQVEAAQAVENALRANEERARLILEQAADAILMGDPVGNFIGVNETACVLTGYAREELLGQNVRVLFSREALAARPLRYSLMSVGESIINERLLTRKDGSQIPVEMRSKRLSDGTLQAIIRDVSERRRLEEQLQLRQRMDSIGTLAGGIAHDFNNILAGIMGYADLLRISKPGLNADQKENIEQILSASRRAADLVRGLQSLSRPGPAQVGSFDLQEVAAEVVHILEETTDRLIVKDLRIEPNRFLVQGDASAVYHALMNLGINAVQAIEEKGLAQSGRVTLSAEHYRAETNERRPLRPGSYVRLTVQDTGMGMTEEVRQRVFDPLFTTKEKGERKGQGLGLAMVYNIVVRQLAGCVEVESVRGAGSAFHLYLPASTSAKTADAPAVAESRGGDEIVLVVEDELQLLALTRAALEQLGYRVLTAKDGQEAVDLFRRHAEDIDLVVLDRTMPRLSGEQVLREMQALRAEVKVLISSGDASIELSSFPGALALLRKPYEASLLGSTIRELLDADAKRPYSRRVNQSEPERSG